jgi:hypothetical protein
MDLVRAFDKVTLDCKPLLLIYSLLSLLCSDFQMLIMCEQEMLRKYELDPNSGKYYEFPIVTLPPPCVLATVLNEFSRASHGQPSSPSLHSAVEEFSRASHGTLVIISGLRPLTVEWSSKMVSCKGSDTKMSPSWTGAR